MLDGINALLGMRHLEPGAVLGIARVSKTMRQSGFTPDETAIMLRALWLGGTRQDLREAWWLFDRQRDGEVPRAEFQQALLDALGDEAFPTVAAQLEDQGAPA